MSVNLDDDSVKFYEQVIAKITFGQLFSLAP